MSLNPKKHLFPLLLLVAAGCSNDPATPENTSCPVDQTRCDDQCMPIDRFASDTFHCGSCLVQCLSTEMCIQGKCVDPLTIECFSSDDCPNHEPCTNRHCSAHAETCRPDTTWCDNQCMSSDDFVNNPKHCGYCNHACGPTQTCQDQTCTETTKTECTTDDDCADGLACIENTCKIKPVINTCEVDSDCSDGLVCIENTCRIKPVINTCEVDSDCIDGLVCIENTCRIKPVTNTCEVDSDCLDGLVCIENTCAPKPTPSPCNTDADCEAHEKCVSSLCEDDPTKPFSIIVLPDTQHYTRTNSGIYEKQTKWIVDNQKKENIKFVLHLGDLTNENTTSQWLIASKAHQLLDQANIPYTVSTGNHDYVNNAETTDNALFGRNRSQFSKYFNESRFAGKTWFKGMVDNDTMVAEFTHGSLKFLVIAAEYAPRKDVLCKLDNLIQAHKDHYVILTTHALLKNGATTNDMHYVTLYRPKFTTFGATGLEFYQELAGRHSNVILAIGGHVCGAEHRARSGYTNNQFYEILTDYQCESPCADGSCVANACLDQEDGGNGWFQKITIDPINRVDDANQPIPNVTVSAHTVLANDQFYQNKPQLFCSPLNQASEHRLYDTDVTAASHAYSFSIDFSKPLDYKYSSYFPQRPNHKAFGVRNVNTDSVGQQTRASVAVSATGDFIVTWMDETPSKHASLRARGFCSGGCSSVDEFVVSESVQDLSTNSIAMDTNGNYAITWTDNDTVKVATFEPGSSKPTALTNVSDESTLPHSAPSIAMNSDGQIVITWQSENAIYYQRYAFSTHTPIGEKVLVYKDTNGSPNTPRVAISRTGSVVVTWSLNTADRTYASIYAKAFNPDDSVSKEMFVLDPDSTVHQHDPAISMSTAGNYYIAYIEDASPDNAVMRVVGYNKSHSIAFANSLVSEPDDNAAYPSLSLTNSQCMLTWTARNSAHSDVKKRIIENNKLMSVTTASITDGKQEKSAVSCNEVKNCVIVFEDDDELDGNTEIFAHGY